MNTISCDFEDHGTVTRLQGSCDEQGGLTIRRSVMIWEPSGGSFWWRACSDRTNFQGSLILTQRSAKPLFGGVGGGLPWVPAFVSQDAARLGIGHSKGHFAVHRPFFEHLHKVDGCSSSKRKRQVFLLCFHPLCLFSDIYLRLSSSTTTLQHPVLLGISSSWRPSCTLLSSVIHHFNQQYPITWTASMRNGKWF